MVGLTISCKPIPGKIYRSKSGFGISVPEEDNSPVKNVMNTSRKNIVFTIGTSRVAHKCAVTSQRRSQGEETHVKSPRLLSIIMGMNIMDEADILLPPLSLHLGTGAFSTLTMNSYSGIFFNSPDSNGAKRCDDISNATHTTAKYFHPTAKDVLGERSNLRFSLRSDS